MKLTSIWSREYNIMEVVDFSATVIGHEKSGRQYKVYMQ